MEEFLLHFFSSSQSLNPLEISFLLAIIILSSLLFFPLLIWKLYCGLQFGILGGFALISLSYLITLWITLFVAQKFFKQQLRHKLKNSAIHSFLQTIENKGPIWILLFRLNPLAHFSALNYSLALTQIPKWKILLYSWLGSTPLTLFTLWLGQNSNSILQTKELISNSPYPYIIGFTLLVICLVYYKTQKKLSLKI